MNIPRGGLANSPLMAPRGQGGDPFPLWREEAERGQCLLVKSLDVLWLQTGNVQGLETGTWAREGFWELLESLVWLRGEGHGGPGSQEETESATFWSCPQPP